MTTKLISTSEKELFFKVMVVSSLAIMVCSRFPAKPNKVESIKLTSVYRDNFGDFDKVHVSNKPPVIAKMISVLKPGFNVAEVNDVAVKIHLVLQKYKI